MDDREPRDQAEERLAPEITPPPGAQGAEEAPQGEGPDELKAMFRGFWTPRRIVLLGVGYVLTMPVAAVVFADWDDVRNAVMTGLTGPFALLPLWATPLLAALALFDLRQGRRTDTQPPDPRRTASRMAFVCVLPFVVLGLCILLVHLAEIFMGPAMFALRHLRGAAQAGQLAAAGRMGLQAVADAAVQVLLWLVVFGVSLVAAATERGRKSASVRACVYGWGAAVGILLISGKLRDVISRDWAALLPDAFVSEVFFSWPARSYLGSWVEVIVLGAVSAIVGAVVWGVLRRKGQKLLLLRA